MIRSPSRPAIKPLLSALLRALIPSWSFFSQVGDTPLLRIRLVDAKGEAKAWTTHASFRPDSAPERGPAHLFYNPEGNGRLAHRSLVMRALEELSRVGDTAFAQSETHLRLQELALSSLPVEYPRLQFQIWVELKDGSEVEAYLSEVFTSSSLQKENSTAVGVRSSVE